MQPTQPTTGIWETNTSAASAVVTSLPVIGLAWWMGKSISTCFTNGNKPHDELQSYKDLRLDLPCLLIGNTAALAGVITLVALGIFTGGLAIGSLTIFGMCGILFSFSLYHTVVHIKDLENTPEPANIPGPLNTPAPAQPRPALTRDSAALKIQQTWRKHVKKQYVGGGVMGPWLKQHHHDFVSHAIQPCNVEDVMKDGHVKPADQIFRDTGTVEYENGQFNNRKTLVVSGQLLEKFKNAVKNVPGPSSEITYSADGRMYVKTISLSKIAIEKFMKEHEGSCRALGLEDWHFKILHDQISDECLDVKLAQIYDKIIKSGINKASARNTCYTIRNGILSRKLAIEIRAGKNSIYWGYGNVVVLRGKGSAVTSSLSGTEAFLKAPFEHLMGLHTTLPLKGSGSEDTLVLGPKGFLERYKKEYGDKIVYIEDLTQKQLDKFEVPLRLRPAARCSQKQAALA